MASSSDSKDNYRDYLKGKASLKHMHLQHPNDGDDSIFNYVKSKVSRTHWVKSFNDWQKVQKNMKRK